jgi:Ca2+-binding EF-hand superfamily protein
MENEQRDQSSIQITEIERLIDEFKEKFKAKTSDADNFITIHEIERMWGELQQNTLNIYSDMVADLMGSIDEGDLIRKKKENTHKEA